MPLTCYTLWSAIDAGRVEETPSGRQKVSETVVVQTSVKEREVKERGTREVREVANKNYKQENRTKLGYLRNNRRTTR